MYLEPKEIERFFEVTDDESKIREFQDKLTEESVWGTPSACCTLSEDFIREFADRIDWSAVTCHQDMSPQFVKEFADKIEWEEFCRYKIITREIVDKVPDKIKWSSIIIFSKLSEDIIEDYLYKFDEYDIVKIFEHQTLSEEFFKRHKELWWNDMKGIKNILSYQKPISREFRKELLLRHRTLLYNFLNVKYKDK